MNAPPLSNWPDAIDHPKTPSKNKLRNLFFNYINMSAENIWRGIDKSSHVWRLSADSARIAQTCNSYLTFISLRWKLSESIPERFSYLDIWIYKYCTSIEIMAITFINGIAITSRNSEGTKQGWSLRIRAWKLQEKYYERELHIIFWNAALIL